MKKSSRKMSFRRETLRIIENDTLRLDGGIYPPKPAQTDLGCSGTLTFSCGCSIGGCH